MRRRLLFVMCCLLAVAFVFPAFAHAASGETVKGTVTVAGAPAEEVRVYLYYRNNPAATWSYWDYWYVGLTKTFEYNDSLYNTDYPDREFQLRAVEATGTYEAKTTAPFKLAENGTQELAIDIDTKDKTAPYRVYGDGTPENSSSGGYWNNHESFVAELRANDAVRVPVEYWNGGSWDDMASGIDRIVYALNGGMPVTVMNYQKPGPWSSTYFETALNVTHEGVNTVAFHAVDRLGNVSRTNTIHVRLDRTAPATTYDKGFKGSSLVLHPSDALAGAESTFWRYGSTGDFNPGAIVPISAATYVEFFSTDKAGNVETVKKIWAAPPAKLATPKASKSRVSRSKSFTVSGSVSGRSKAKGYLRVYKLSKGKYKYLSKKSFTEASNGKYKVSFKFKTGTYKFRATYGANTSNTANPAVSSKLSAKVRVY